MESSVLKQLAHAHRQGNLICDNTDKPKTACTMILADVGEQDDSGVPLKESSKAKKGGLAREEEDIEYIALSISRKNPELSSRVVWKQSKIDVEEDEDMVGKAPQLVIPKPRLRCGEITRVRRDWSDVHIYVISPWVRALWKARPSLVSLQGDLIPLLVSRQFRGVKATFGRQEQAESVYAETFMEEKNDEETNSEEVDSEEYAVRAEVLDGSKVLRASTVPAYLIACRDIVIKSVADENRENPCLVVPPDTNINTKFNSFILKGAELGEKCQVKSSTVGRNAKLGTKARLNNTLLMDNVHVGDNTILQNSIIGEGCVIGENCNLNDCQVPNGKVIPPGTKEKGE
eukprot:CAMPEP_0202445650 /NCGR_PEP_ID=MMETSP1360-20130828/4421_1 /ASSEMBLY_ACC=CAM_ASM_000848 /TAXON_ID=515479 /ORGANISM="Licmophora paradoxa, Strain CCMP2313" /LENGTH=344 /DNA_ID=CAMNT_0049061981 /DNA_START=270 /DNA_END=1301 /DNA_ORIENTATION=-